MQVDLDGNNNILLFQSKNFTTLLRA